MHGTEGEQEESRPMLSSVMLSSFEQESRLLLIVLQDFFYMKSCYMCLLESHLECSRKGNKTLCNILWGKDTIQWYSGSHYKML